LAGTDALARPADTAEGIDRQKIIEELSAVGLGDTLAPELASDEFTIYDVMRQLKLKRRRAEALVAKWCVAGRILEVGYRYRPETGRIVRAYKKSGD